MMRAIFPEKVESIANDYLPHSSSRIRTTLPALNITVKAGWVGTKL